MSSRPPRVPSAMRVVLEMEASGLPDEPADVVRTNVAGEGGIEPN